MNDYKKKFDNRIKAVLVASAGSSTRIAGSKLSNKEVKKILSKLSIFNVYLEEEKFEDILSPKQYEVWKYISSVGESSPAQISKKSGVLIATVRQALLRLVELNKVKRLGRGPQTRYVKVS